MLNKKVLSKINLGKYVKHNPYKKDIIYDPKGQWKYPGQNTRIPGKDITMEGVPYPVYAKPNVGKPQMMYPDQNYQFSGADYVDEFPQMKKGGRTKGLVSMPKPSKKGLMSKKYSKSLDATNKLFTENYLFAKPKSRKNKVFDPNSKYYAEGGEYEDAELTPEEIEEYRANGYIVDDTIYQKGGVPTYADSLFLYNNSLDLNKWMKKNKYHWSGLQKYNSNRWNRENLYDLLKALHERDIAAGSRTRPLSKHVKKVGNFIGTSDWQGGGLDDYGLPFTWKHPNIKPQQEGDMLPDINTNGQALSYSFRYDPIAIKPAKLLKDAEIIKRYKKYGKSGISESRLKKLGLLKDDSKNTQTFIKSDLIKNTDVSNVPEKIENLPILKPSLIQQQNYQLQGNSLNKEVESEYLEPGSPDTENPMEWVDKRKRYIDWDGLQIPYRLPRFRKPGSYGPLIKKGKKRYINLPTIKSRNTAYLKEEKNGELYLLRK